MLAWRIAYVIIIYGKTHNALVFFQSQSQEPQNVCSYPTICHPIQLANQCNIAPKNPRLHIEISSLMNENARNVC